MSIVPASRLSSSDLSRLGNNVSRSGHSKKIRAGSADRRRLVAAVNRSLATLGEHVVHLRQPLLPAF